MITELERRLMDAFHEDALHARLVHPDASSDHGEGRSHLQLDAARLEHDAHLVPAKEIVVALDSPTSETPNRRRLAMAAAAIVAVVGVAAIAISRRNANDDVEPAPAATTTVAPTTVAPRGVYDVAYTVPDGWEDIGRGVIKRDPAFGMRIVSGDEVVYTSYCVTPGAFPGNRTMTTPESVGPPVGPAVDDLVSAWANLPGVDATAARDVTIDGFHGKQIEFTVPDYDAGDCNGVFGFCHSKEVKMWCESFLWDRDFSSDVSYQPLPHQHLKIWILDVHGFRQMIMAWSFPDTSPQDRGALDEIVASIRLSIGWPAAPTTVASATVTPTTGNS